jgi:Flp pilus assembly protein TadD
MLGAARDYHHAVTHFRQALVLREAYPEAYNNLALALGARGRLDEAIAAVTRALELRPAFADASHNLQVLLSQRRGEP